MENKNTSLAPQSASTPGPWFVGSPIRSNDTLGICHKYEDDPENLEETIAEVLPGGLPGNMEADARLIASAPELLVALCDMVAATDHYTADRDTNEAIVKARAAIANATKGANTQ